MSHSNSIWIQKKLCELITLQRGHDLTNKDRKDGIIPVMGAAGQNGYHNKAIALGPGVIVGRSGGSYGKVHLIKEDYWPHNTALYVSDYKGNDPYFVYYLLKILDFSSLNSGSAQPSLNRNYVYPISVNIPKPKEQKDIAKVLADIDSKIELNNKINKELESLARAFYNYWFVQFDFPISAEQAAVVSKPQLEGKPYRASGGPMEYNAVLKREVPKGWEVKTLNQLGEFRNGINYSKDDKGERTVRIVNVRDLSNSTYYILKDDLDEISLPQKEVEKYLLSDNDILVARSSCPGATRMIYSGIEDVIFSGFIINFTVIDKTIKNYLFHSLKRIEIIINNSMSGTILKNVNQDYLKELVVTVPDDSILKKFNNKIDPISKAIFNYSKQNQELIRLRDFLLPLLMNGQVRVKNKSKLY